MDDSFENWLKERAPETDADDGRLSPGTIIGAYHVETFLGKGGFAEVYGAKTVNGERVAIKILHRLDDQSRMRFERESNILSQIHHPNIPKLLSFGSCGNRPYLVMEMLEAKDLPHSDKAIASFIKAVCRAADALHKMGYVHRDIKPSNVLWRGDTPVLIDFGLACLKTNVPRPPSTISIVDGQRIVVGTMGYAAPEQFAGGRIDEATDVHAIGMLADACFNGHPPRCWRKIIDRATNSRNRGRFATAKTLARKVSLRHFGRRLMVALFVLACAYNLLVAHLGWSSVLYGIGACYKNGWCVPANAAKAERWFSRAAKANTDFWLHIDASLMEHPRSTEEILKGAESGEVEDLVRAADLYREGRTLSRDYDRSVELYRNAIASGSFDAVARMGVMYEYGMGVEKNLESSFLMYLVAAGTGQSSNSIHDVIRCYENGIGVTRNATEAMRWRRQLMLRPLTERRSELLERLDADGDRAILQRERSLLSRPTTVANCNGVDVNYLICSNGTVEIAGCFDAKGRLCPAIARSTTGAFVIPDLIAGRRVSAVGPFAFNGCTNLLSLTLPVGIERVEFAAFAQCPQLRVRVSHENPNIVMCGDALYSHDMSVLMSYVGTNNVVKVDPRVKCLGRGAFAYSRTLRELALPEGLVRIDPLAIVACHNLSSVVMPSTVRDVGANAFVGCYNFSSIFYRGRQPTVDKDAYAGHEIVFSFVRKDAGWETVSGTLPLTWPESWGEANAVMDKRERFGKCWPILYWDGVSIPDRGELLRICANAMERQAEHGNVAAMSYLGARYRTGWGGVKRNGEKAFKYLLGAASSGNVEDMGKLGILYRDGVTGGVKGHPDYNEAIKWFMRAISDGGRWGVWVCQELAPMYRDGKGVPQDTDVAFLLYLIAASHNMVWAQCEVGNCYLNGIGVVRNQGGARKWFRRAAAWRRRENSPEYGWRLKGAVEYAERKLKELERLNCESISESCKMKADMCQ